MYMYMQFCRSVISTGRRRFYDSNSKATGGLQFIPRVYTNATEAIRDNEVADLDSQSFG